MIATKILRAQEAGIEKIKFLKFERWNLKTLGIKTRDNAIIEFPDYNIYPLLS